MRIGKIVGTLETNLNGNSSVRLQLGRVPKKYETSANNNSKFALISSSDNNDNKGDFFLWFRWVDFLVQYNTVDG